MDHNVIAHTLISQYQAAFAMLERPITHVDDGLWLASEPQNAFWHIAFHCLHYTDLYLHQSEDDFTPWELFIADSQFMGPKPWPPFEVPVIGDPYTRQEILEYLNGVRNRSERLVTMDSFEAPSGFLWLPITRFELHLYNIRHIQHHAGQLYDRSFNANKEPLGWVGSGPDAR